MWSDTGRRTLKYHQTLDEVLDLADDERAVLTVLLLRGPSAAGALKTRTDRLHTFADRTDGRGDAARGWPSAAWSASCRARVGERDTRWTHLLGGAEPASRGGPPPTVQVADRALERDDRVRAAYDAVAGAYSEHAVQRAQPGCPSRPGCWTGSPRTPTADRWSRSAADRAT